MNVTTLYPRFLEYVAKTYPNEWNLIKDDFDCVDETDAKQIEEIFEYIESDRSIKADAFCETYHYPFALRFFREWSDSSELHFMWTEVDWIDNRGNDTPEALLKAAREEFEETGPYDKRPLCDAVCEWNRVIIFEIYGVIASVWEQMKREAE